jgi:hypothetical protein
VGFLLLAFLSSFHHLIMLLSLYLLRDAGLVSLGSLNIFSDLTVQDPLMMLVVIYARSVFLVPEEFPFHVSPVILNSALRDSGFSSFVPQQFPGFFFFNLARPFSPDTSTVSPIAPSRFTETPL